MRAKRKSGSPRGLLCTASDESRSSTADSEEDGVKGSSHDERESCAMIIIKTCRAEVNCKWDVIETVDASFPLSIA